MVIARPGSDGHRAGLNEALHPVCNRLIDEVASGFIKTLALECGMIPHRCPRAGVADHVDILDDRAAVGRIEQVTGANTSMTATACLVYFVARAAHFVIYTFAIPLVRTVVFIAGFAAQMVLALTLLGMI